MTRLTLFAKGNVDVKDSLHSFRADGKVLWNGINEIIRARFPGISVHVKHETWTRSDALLASSGHVPAEIGSRALSLGHYPAAAQFSHALFDLDPAAFVLSIQPDLTTPMLRHRSAHYLFYPSGWETWPSADQAWLRESFEPVPPLDVVVSMENFRKIVARIREHSKAPILIYNVSSVVPGDFVHCHQGLDDVFATRARRFNLGLVELSQETGISIIDVDTIVARAGADRLKLDALHLGADGYRLIAEEVVRVLDDLGCFAGDTLHAD
jgi:hypothetical protein